MIGVATLNSLDPAAEAAAEAVIYYILVPPKSLSGEETERRIGQISGLNYVFTPEDLDKLQVSTAEGHEHHYRTPNSPVHVTSHDIFPSLGALEIICISN